ncbi:MAG: hypothetical protein EBY84_05715, partial [Acidimicrobiia bacterium]|nr:hypothetical protein [Acidimicrobiia bacterium]
MGRLGLVDDGPPVVFAVVFSDRTQVQVDRLPEGVGDLYAAFERLKRDLAERGYFDPARKKTLPRMPLRVGIATSETGAAIRDMVSTIERRLPIVSLVLRPTLV